MAGKFQMPNFPSRPAPVPVPRASALKIIRPRASGVIPKGSPRIKKAISKPSAGKPKMTKIHGKGQKSILDFMSKQNTKELKQGGLPHHRNALTMPMPPDQGIQNTETYIEQLKSDISAGRRKLSGNPWVYPNNPFQEIVDTQAQRMAAGEPQLTSPEALCLFVRPVVFIWAPQILAPASLIRCPACHMPAAREGWGSTKILHKLAGQCLYIATKHACRMCPGHNPTAKSKKKQCKKTFLADEPEVVAQLPESVKSLWSFVDTGRTLCEHSLADLIHALSTRTSWSAIADSVNEMKETSWVREVTVPLLKLYKQLDMLPATVALPTALPQHFKINEKWVRNFFVMDRDRRQEQMRQELLAEEGDDVLIMDWTVTAATRCGGAFLFNAMSGARKVLASAITATAGISEVKPLVFALAARGVKPKVVYVDCECCTGWPKVLDDIWPGVAVRLDGLDAVMRLAKTTSSTQHPWQGLFCAMLSAAIYAYDQQVLARLRDARERAGLSRKLPKGTKSRYVPRIIRQPRNIANAINRIIEIFTGRSHPEMGQLLTPDTNKAWELLSTHVLAGCLSDPPCIMMNLYDERNTVTIGGEVFQSVRTVRGTSALEGFHAHQQSWLGAAQHAMDAGLALLAEGVTRWNRKRHNEAGHRDDAIPMVFGSSLLQEANELNKELSGAPAYQNYKVANSAQRSPIDYSADVGRVCSTAQKLATDLERLPQNIAMPADMVTDIEQWQLHQNSTVPAGIEVACSHEGKSNIDIESSSQNKLGAKDTGKMEKNAGGLATAVAKRPSESECKVVSGSRSGCRKCHATASPCRLYKHIQWCEQDGVSFDEWIATVFPTKKTQALETAAKRMARATGKRGRPKKTITADVTDEDAFCEGTA